MDRPALARTGVTKFGYLFLPNPVVSPPDSLTCDPEGGGGDVTVLSFFGLRASRLLRIWPLAIISSSEYLVGLQVWSAAEIAREYWRAEMSSLQVRRNDWHTRQAEGTDVSGYPVFRLRPKLGKATKFTVGRLCRLSVRLASSGSERKSAFSRYPNVPARTRLRARHAG